MDTVTQIMHTATQIVIVSMVKHNIVWWLKVRNTQFNMMYIYYNEENRTMQQVFFCKK